MDQNNRILGEAKISKLLLNNVPAKMMAAFLYLGAGLGLFIMGIVQKMTVMKSAEQPLTKKELPYTVAMVALDIAAPIFLMIGLTRCSAANASLLNNFEIVATSMIALLIFREKLSKRFWVALELITLSSLLLSVEDARSFSFSVGSLYVLLACCCWGMENNCTRMLSQSDPQQIVIVKGFGSGVGSMIVALIAGEMLPDAGKLLMVLLLGFVAYGLSIYFYVYAQRFLGAARTSAYYAVQPFIGVLLSLLIFREMPGVLFFAALALMIGGTWLVTKDQAE